MERCDYMALLKCPECNSDISDSAVSCPHCGFPLKQTDAYQQGYAQEQGAIRARTEQRRKNIEIANQNRRTNNKISFVVALILGIISFEIGRYGHNTDAIWAFGATIFICIGLAGSVGSWIMFMIGAGMGAKELSKLVWIPSICIGFLIGYLG